MTTQKLELTSYHITVLKLQGDPDTEYKLLSSPCTTLHTTHSGPSAADIIVLSQCLYRVIL